MIDISPFRQLIKEKSGICFDKTGSDLLVAEIQSMMTRTGCKTPRDCYDLLVNSHEEFFRFLNLITVNETYFFREPAHLRLFSEKLLPEIFTRRGRGEKIRILSAGCSTGEEPYSLAILLWQKYGSETLKLFSVIGADIDTGAIQKAREGIYTARAFRTAEPALKNCFTDLGNSRFRIKENIGSAVCFHILNLLNAPYPQQMQNTDFIFYRNVSIYFDPAARKKIFQNLADILSPGGYLIVSATETLSHDYSILSLIQRDGIFLFCKSTENPPGAAGAENSSRFSAPSLAYRDREQIRKQVPRQPVLSGTDHRSAASEMRMPQPAGISGTSPRASRSPDHKKEILPPEDLCRKAVSLAQSRAYDSALELLEKNIDAHPYFLPAKTLRAGILFNTGHTDAAARICEEAVQINPLCLEACLLLGLIAKSQGQTEEALRRFRQAIYIRSSAWLPHFHTAEIYRTLGENQKAIREYQTVITLITTRGFGEHGLSFFPFSFSQENILHLCRHNMEKITRKNTAHADTGNRASAAKEKNNGI